MRVWIPILIVIVLAVAGWFFFTQTQAPAEPVSVETPEPEPAPALVEEPAPAESVEPPPIEPPPAPEPAEPEEPLPALADSDPLAAEMLAQFFGEAMVVRYFTAESIVAKAVASLDALGSRQVPANILAINGPQGGFEAVPVESTEAPIVNEAGDPIPQFDADPATYARYLAYVEMLESVDAEQFVAGYRRNYPLFQQAWRELGYAEGEFNDRLLQVLDELIATPEAPEPLRLIKPEAYYLFADEALEALPAGQKILLRMGNDNARRVKARLAEIRRILTQD